MDRKKVEFLESNDLSISVITSTMYLGTPSSTGPRPVTIFHNNETTRDEVPKVPTPVLVVEVPRPFPYESQKVIPWDYNCNYTHQTAVNDLTGIGGITRNGRCYAPVMAEKVVSDELLILTSEEQPSKERAILHRKNRKESSKKHK